MFTKMEHFKKDWAAESDSTLKIFQALTNDSLSQKVYDEGRSIADLVWHIILTLGEMPSSIGLSIEAPNEHTEDPNDINTYVELYSKASASFLNQILEKWNDSNLLQEFDIYGEKWTGGFLLEALIRHQIHHRAQITVLMRQANLKVPGVYGPAKEEWAAYGMPAPK